MLMQLNINASAAVLSDLHTQLAASFGPPCPAEPPGVTQSWNVAVWRRPRSVIVLSATPGDTGSTTISLLATSLKPHTQAARERYEAVLAASRQALPAPCR